MPLLIVGSVLIGISWFLAWTQLIPLAVYYFPPLWLGYILVVNGLCEVFWRDSVMRRMRWSFLLLFVISIPMWWFFEYLNTIVQNWHYLLPSEWWLNSQM